MMGVFISGELANFRTKMIAFQTIHQVRRVDGARVEMKISKHRKHCGAIELEFDD